MRAGMSSGSAVRRLVAAQGPQNGSMATGAASANTEPARKRHAYVRRVASSRVLSPASRARACAVLMPAPGRSATSVQQLTPSRTSQCSRQA